MSLIIPLILRGQFEIREIKKNHLTNYHNNIYNNFYLISYHCSDVNLYLVLKVSNSVEVCVSSHVFEEEVCVSSHVFEEEVCVSSHVFEEEVCVSSHVFEEEVCVRLPCI